MKLHHGMLHWCHPTKLRMLGQVPVAEQAAHVGEPPWWLWSPLWLWLSWLGQVQEERKSGEGEKLGGGEELGVGEELGGGEELGVELGVVGLALAPLVADHLQ